MPVLARRERLGAFVAALPMYDWAEERATTDAVWADIRDRLRADGIDAPQGLVRRNADLPAVPGGIRDADGSPMAPDPAMLPPEDLDFPTLFRHPLLLLCQTCWGPLELGLAPHVQVVGQPSYDGIEGGKGIFYSSAVLMRKDEGETSARDLSDGPLLPLPLLAGKRFAFNGGDSMSGLIAITRDLDAAGEGLGIFSERIETGAHRASIRAVAEGGADVCAIDCRSWQLAMQHEPQAPLLHAVGWTALRKGLPMITSRHTPPDIVETLRAVFQPA